MQLQSRWASVDPETNTAKSSSAVILDFFFLLLTCRHDPWEKGLVQTLACFCQWTKYDFHLQTDIFFFLCGLADDRGHDAGHKHLDAAARTKNVISQRFQEQSFIKRWSEGICFTTNHCEESHWTIIWQQQQRAPLLFFFFFFFSTGAINQKAITLACSGDGLSDFDNFCGCLGVLRPRPCCLPER